jgi:hypothetical protein
MKAKGGDSVYKPRREAPGGTSPAMCELELPISKAGEQLCVLMRYYTQVRRNIDTPLCNTNSWASLPTATNCVSRTNEIENYELNFNLKKVIYFVLIFN